MRINHGSLANWYQMIKLDMLERLKIPEKYTITYVWSTLGKTEWIWECNKIQDNVIVNCNIVPNNCQ